MAANTAPKRMELRKHEPATQVPMPNGTCFVMKTLPYPDGRWPPERNNNHPFIVLQSNKDGNCVLCAMARTLTCDYEGKDHSAQFRIHGDTCIEIESPHPPMEPSETRRQYADLSSLIWIPKRELFNDDSFKICQTGARDDPTPLLAQPVMTGYDEKGQPVVRSQIDCIRAKVSQLAKKGAIQVFDWYDYAHATPEDKKEYYSLEGCPTDPLYEKIVAAREREERLAKEAKERAERAKREKQNHGRKKSQKPRRKTPDQPSRSEWKQKLRDMADDWDEYA